MVKSDLFKTLSKDKQKYYLDLEKTKGLLAATKEELVKKDSIIGAQKYNLNNTKVTDSLICFDKNAAYNFIGNKNNLYYKIDLLFKDSLSYKLNYKYAVTIDSRFLKQKDGSILIQHKLSDPDAVILTGQAFIIPAPKPNWFEKNVKWVLPVSSFIGGFVVSQRIK